MQNLFRPLSITTATAAALLALSGPAMAAPSTETLPNGIKITHTVEGKGAQPGPNDTVKVHYKGTLDSGKEFDSSYKRNAPSEFPLNKVIVCWGQGLQKIKVGGKATLVCPPETAYGVKGAGALVPSNATLTFEVELLDVIKAQ